MKHIKRIVIEFLIGLPIVIGVSALLDWLYHLIIIKEPYVFSFSTCSICVTSWLVMEIVLYIIRMKKSDK